MGYNEYEFYTEFAQAVFTYLNGRINPKNKVAGLEFTGADIGKLCTLEQNTYEINLFVGSIVSEYGYYCRFTVKAIIAFVIARELVRASLNVNIYRYRISDSYMEEIESKINEAAYQFLITNGEEMIKKTDMDYDIDHIKEMYKDWSKLNSASYIDRCIAHTLAIQWDMFK